MWTMACPVFGRATPSTRPILSSGYSGGFQRSRSMKRYWGTRAPHSDSLGNMPVIPRRTVWILGSGFSRSLGGPLLHELISTSGLNSVVSTYQSKERLVEARAIFKAGLDLELWSDAESFLDRLDVATEHPNSAPALQLCVLVNNHKKTQICLL